jgi:hypothetical protein
MSKDNERPTIAQRIKKIAGQADVELQTVRVWVREGLDVHDQAAVESCIERKRSRRKGKSLAQSAQSIPVSADDICEELSTIDPDAIGAAANLKRLEAFESLLARRLELALASGDAPTIQTARQDYVTVSETLRKLDIAVDTYRRDAGELIARDEAAEAVRVLTEQLKIGFNLWLSSEVPALQAIDSPGKFVQHARRTYAFVFIENLKNTQKSRAAIPQWAWDIVKEELYITE